MTQRKDLPHGGQAQTAWAKPAPAVQQLDAARLFRLALETAPAGSVPHAVADDLRQCVA